MNRLKRWRFLFIFVFLSMSGTVLHAAEREYRRNPVGEGVLVLWNGVAEALDHLVAVFWSDNGGSLDPFGQPKPQGGGSPGSGS